MAWVVLAILTVLIIWLCPPILLARLNDPESGTYEERLKKLRKWWSWRAVLSFLTTNSPEIEL